MYSVLEDIELLGKYGKKEMVIEQRRLKVEKRDGY